MPTDLELLEAHVRDHLPPGSWTAWPGGHPHAIEAALIDAVLSIRASYGSPTTGVRGAIARYRTARGGELDDLFELGGHADEELATVLGNRQVTSGRLKAAAIAEAARNLTAAGVHSAADLRADAVEHRRAYCRVHGLGWITWSYFTMLLGHPGVKADTWVVRYLTEALDRPVAAEEAAELVTAVAHRLGEKPTDIDHAIWRHASGRQPVRPPGSAPARARPDRRRADRRPAPAPRSSRCRPRPATTTAAASGGAAGAPA